MPELKTFESSASKCCPKGSTISSPPRPDVPLSLTKGHMIYIRSCSGFLTGSGVVPVEEVLMEKRCLLSYAWTPGGGVAVNAVLGSVTTSDVADPRAPNTNSPKVSRIMRRWSTK